MRVRQELVLGIGGMRALEVAGLRPTVRHANEGHAAFLGLERIRQLRAERGLTFAEAREIATAGNVFTTHTPVPAGIDLFPRDVMTRYFEREAETFGISFEDLLGLGRQVPEDPNESFSMAVLGLRLSSRVNAVSKLHASVSRRLWRGVFPDAPLSEIPIGAVTNGVHGPSWTSKEIGALNPREGDGPDPAELWRRHEHRRAALVETVRIRTAAARTRRGAPDGDVAAAWQLLDPSALTIGFARRFATYKRATLIFQDAARLARILADPARPVQLLFAGKAHPRDHAGKDFLRRVGEFSARPEFLGRVVLVEDYDMRLARRLVQGVDVWLNNAAPAVRGVRHVGDEGRDERRPEPVRSGRLVGRGSARRRRVHDRGYDGGAPGRGDGESPLRAPRGGDHSSLLRPAERRPLRSPVRLGGEDGRGGLPPRADSSTRSGCSPSTSRRRTCRPRTASRCCRRTPTRRRRSSPRGSRRSAPAWDEVGFVSVTTVPEEPARVAAGQTFTVEVQIRLGTLEPADLAVDWFEGEPDHDGVVDAGFSTPLASQGRQDGTADVDGDGRAAPRGQPRLLRARASRASAPRPSERDEPRPLGRVVARPRRRALGRLGTADHGRLRARAGARVSAGRAASCGPTGRTTPRRISMRSSANASASGCAIFRMPPESSGPASRK